jgi:hypothetical protein
MNYDDCEVYSDSEACDSNFQPTTDWLEYERLKTIESVMSCIHTLEEINMISELIGALNATNHSFDVIKKENEELKHLIKLMKCTRITS